MDRRRQKPVPKWKKRVRRLWVRTCLCAAILCAAVVIRSTYPDGSAYITRVLNDSTDIETVRTTVAALWER